MNIDTLNTLDKLPLIEARFVATKLIDRKKTTRLTQFRLERDIEKARSSAEVSKIAHNIYLSGEGLAVVGSVWKKDY